MVLRRFFTVLGIHPALNYDINWQVFWNIEYLRLISVLLFFYQYIYFPYITIWELYSDIRKHQQTLFGCCVLLLMVMLQHHSVAECLHCIPEGNVLNLPFQRYRLYRWRHCLQRRQHLWSLRRRYECIGPHDKLLLICIVMHLVFRLVNLSVSVGPHSRGFIWSRPCVG